MFAQADAVRLPLADGSVDLVFTSPPYMDARTYGIAAQRDCETWIEWMLQVVAECVRVCRGLVLVNCAGVTRDWCYWPGCEGLLYRWWSRGGRCWRPCYWRRVGIPGSGRRQWYRADVEYVLAFTGCEKGVPWAEPTANGHRPSGRGSGRTSNRRRDGTRVNSCGRNRRDSGGKHTASGRAVQVCVMPKLANPGNLIAVPVGGGRLGSPLAHENEAPFPESLAAFFIRSHCPPGGIVLDPFSGSGTTVAAALKLGRRGIGLDLRLSQCQLGRRRIAEDVGLFALAVNGEGGVT